MPLFRFHRGGLYESLQTTIIVKDIQDLMNVIKNSYENFLPKNIKTFGVIIGPYPDNEMNFDKRIGWYTQMVTSDIHERGDFKPEGFLSEPFNE